MGPVFVLLYVVASAAASYNSLPPRNFYDGFRPDYMVESSFKNYWMNPAMSSFHRFWAGPVPFSHDYRMRHVMGGDYISFMDLFEKPMIAITPSPMAPNTFTAFYLHNGLRSMYRYKSFNWLMEYTRTPGMKSLVFSPKHMYNLRFFETPISSVVIQDDCRMSDFLMISGLDYKIPYMFIAPESVFDDMHFDNIAKISNLKIYNDIFEVEFPPTQNKISSNNYHSAASVQPSVPASATLVRAEMTIPQSIDALHGRSLPVPRPVDIDVEAQAVGSIVDPLTRSLPPKTTGSIMDTDVLNASGTAEEGH